MTTKLVITAGQNSEFGGVEDALPQSILLPQIHKIPYYPHHRSLYENLCTSTFAWDTAFFSPFHHNFIRFWREAILLSVSWKITLNHFPRNMSSRPNICVNIKRTILRASYPFETFKTNMAIAIQSTGIIFVCAKYVYILKNLGQYDRPRVLGCEPVDGVLVVFSSNQINIATFVHQMADTHISHLVNKHSNICFTLFTLTGINILEVFIEKKLFSTLEHYLG